MELEPDMAKESILVVDDEEDILELVQYNLSREGYHVYGVSSGEDAISKAQKDAPHLIILDLMLPGIDGLEVCQSLKSDSRTKNIPIIMLTAKGEDADVVLGLELGADDYIVKPFSPVVLRARVKAALRRNKTSSTEQTFSVKRIKELCIDPIKHQVTVKGAVLPFTATEFQTLTLFASHPGRVFTRHQIIVAVHGHDYPVTDRSIDVQIAGLRKKLGDYGDNLETIRGVGYRFKE